MWALVLLWSPKKMIYFGRRVSEGRKRSVFSVKKNHQWRRCLEKEWTKVGKRVDERKSAVNNRSKCDHHIIIILYTTIRDDE